MPSRCGVRIVSYSSEQFKDRQEAGQLLADELKYLLGKEVVVLGIPRGGVVVAGEMPEFLGAISQFYVYFEQTSDEEVLRILKEEHSDEKRIDTFGFPQCQS